MPRPECTCVNGQATTPNNHIEQCTNADCPWSGEELFYTYGRLYRVTVYIPDDEVPHSVFSCERNVTAYDVESALHIAQCIPNVTKVSAIVDVGDCYGQLS